MANDIPSGVMTPEAMWGNFNQQAFVINQFINKMQTATLVQIKSVTNAGGVSAVGYVDILPLVNQVDSNGLSVPHVTIHNIPYMRIQGGSNAIILDPQVGDIGICVFASRDIGKVKSAKSQSNPGSNRKYDYGDGLYVGGVLNSAPSQYVQFSASGITIHSPNLVNLQAPDVKINATSIEINATNFTVNASLQVNGTANISGDLTANGTSLHNHEHTSSAPGSPTSPPI